MKLSTSLKFALLLLAVAANIFAGNNNPTRDLPQPNLQPVEMEIKTHPYLSNRNRNVPAVEFIVDPIQLIETYYDYMPGGYNRNPLQLQPEFSDPNNYPADGYYVAYHANTSYSAERRIYYNYIDPNEVASTSTPISSTNFREGFPSIAIDPLTASPLVIWHNDNDNDNVLECTFSYDLFNVVGCPGLWIPDITLIDNPMAEAGQFANLGEFIWPVVSIGPSPVPGKRRAHVYANFAPNTGDAEYNCIYGYSDFYFNSSAFEMDFEDWTFQTFPVWDEWQLNETKRAIKDFVVSPIDGKVAFVGFAGTDFFMMSSDDYGETFEYYETTGRVDLENPQNEDGTFYFTNDDDTPATIFAYPSSDGTHYNAFFDETGEKIVAMGAYGINTEEGLTNSTYLPGMFYPKIFNYSLESGELEVDVVDLYIEGVDPNDDQPMIPWDLDEDGIVDEFQNDGTVTFVTSMPSWFWGGEFSDSFYKESLFKIGRVENYMVAIWQDAAGIYENFNEVPGYENWAEKPQIAIAVSADNGVHWSQPAFMNANSSDENYFSELSGMIPTYVYTADDLEVITETASSVSLEVPLFFCDDNSYGSYVHGFGNNSGGTLNYAKIQVDFEFEDSSATSIHDIQYTEDAGDGTYPSPLVDQEVTISGIVTGSNYAGTKYYICDLPEFGSGPWHGIYVYNVSDPAPELGDVVQVTGTVIEYYGVTEIGYSTYSVISTEYPVPAAMNVTTNDLVSSITAEQYESCLVQLNNVTVTSEPNEYGEWYVTDGVGECQIDDGFFYLDEVDPPIIVEEGYTFQRIKGILDYSYDIYGLSPRSPQDMFSSDIIFGDIDYNGLVQAYDAALTLQYTVGYDPIPGDPRPWENNRIIAADVDGNGDIQSYDAALILQYSIGLIEEFPVESRESEASRTCELIVSVEDDCFIFEVEGELIGFDLTVENEDISLGTPELLNWDSAILAYNSDTGYNLAIASALPATESTQFLKIPFSGSAEEVSLEVCLNSVPQTITTATTSGSNGNDVQYIDQTLGNYPNPFNPTTNISFSVKENNTPVNVKIYNIKGELVKSYEEELYNTGIHKVKWNGNDNKHKAVSSGVYFNRISIGEKHFNSKMILLK